MVQVFLQCATCEYFGSSRTSVICYMWHFSMVQEFLQCATRDILKWFNEFCNVLHVTFFDGSKNYAMCYNSRNLCAIYYMCLLSMVQGLLLCATFNILWWFQQFCNVLRVTSFDFFKTLRNVIHVASFDSRKLCAMYYMWLLLMVQWLLLCATCGILRWLKQFCNVLHVTSFDSRKLCAMYYLWLLATVENVAQCTACDFFQWCKPLATRYIWHLSIV